MNVHAGAKPIENRKSAIENRTALFVSPHLDDVAFSCGGTAARFAAEGARVVVVTLFTATVPGPTGFALACQTDKGLSADVDYMALRRAEDEAFAECVGAEVVHFDHPEAPHRGYESAEALFGAVRDEDAIWKPVRDDLAALIEKMQPDVLFAPQALGGHVDHVQAVRAVEALPERLSTRWYRDLPYALRLSDADLWPTDHDEVVDITEALPAKLRGAAAYTSQIGFQFGGEGALREALAAFAHDEAARFGQEGAAEVMRLRRGPQTADDGPRIT